MRTTTDTVPSAGSIGEPKSKRIPGREDVPEELKQEQLAPTSSELSLQDVELMIVLLDTCAQRGSFKIEEYGLVSTLHQKLHLVIQAATSDK